MESVPNWLKVTSIECLISRKLITTLITYDCIMKQTKTTMCYTVQNKCLWSYLERGEIFQGVLITMTTIFSKSMICYKTGLKQSL